MGAGGGLAPGAGVHRRHRGGGAQELGRARADREGRLVHAPVLAGVRMHVHDPLPRARRHHEPVAAGGHLAEPGADHQQEVGLPDPLGEVRIDAQPEVAGVAGVGVVEAILAAERRRGGERVRFHESGEIVARARRPAAAAGDDQRATGVGQQRPQGRKRVGGDPRSHRGVRPRVGDHDLLGQHVLGQGHGHRSRPSGARPVERLAHELGDAGRIVDLRDPLAQRLEEPPVLDLLERLAIGVPALDLADEQHHRRRVLGGVVEPDRRVAGAGAAGDHDDARPPRQLAVGLRHVGGAALVPAGDGRDGVARVVEGVERREEALARHAEDGVDAMDAKRVDQDPAAGAPAILHHVRHRVGRNSRANRGARILAHNMQRESSTADRDCVPICVGGSMRPTIGERRPSPAPSGAPGTEESVR